jgi:hypothetical protein
MRQWHTPKDVQLQQSIQQGISPYQSWMSRSSEESGTSPLQRTVFLLVKTKSATFLIPAVPGGPIGLTNAELRQQKAP